MSKKALYSWLV